jgi:hypothetical protein
MIFPNDTKDLTFWVETFSAPYMAVKTHGWTVAAVTVL